MTGLSPPTFYCLGRKARYFVDVSKLPTDQVLELLRQWLHGLIPSSRLLPLHDTQTIRCENRISQPPWPSSIVPPTAQYRFVASRVALRTSASSNGPSPEIS